MFALVCLGWSLHSFSTLILLQYQSLQYQIITMYYLRSLTPMLALGAMIEARAIDKAARLDGAIEARQYGDYGYGGAAPVEATPDEAMPDDAQSSAIVAFTVDTAVAFAAAGPADDPPADMPAADTPPPAASSKAASSKAASSAAASPAAASPAAASPAAAAPKDDKATGSAAGGAAAGKSARCIYISTNADDNAVVAMPVGADGLLFDAVSIPTGGKGASLIDAKTGQPVATDTLASQGAIRVVGSNLFVVNAGSNSLTMFTISADDATQLTMVGQPVSTGGDFPTSVAATKDLSTVCVGHTGAKAGVSCSTFDATTGLGTFDALRPYALGQTNPPTGPTNGIGITFFSSDAKTLVTTVKGDPASNGKLPGFVSTFTVDASGAVGTKDTQTTPKDTAVLFGTAPIPDTNMVLATDASFGSAVLNLDNLAAPVTTTNLTNQKATCWAAINPATGTGFVTDVGVNHMVEVNLQDGSVIADAFADNANPGMIDLQVSGDKIYALAPGNGTSSACSVAVWDISGGEGSAGAVQNFAVKGADNRAMGMTFVL